LLGRAWLFRDQDGNPERWIGANIDITERKRAEEDAKKLLRLLDLSFDAIVLRDAADRVRYWNRGAHELYGWTPDEALGSVTHSLLQTVFPEPLESIIATVRREGRWQGELTHRSKEGRCVTVVSRWGLLNDWESGQQWIMETNTDITHRKTDEVLSHASAQSAPSLSTSSLTATNSLL
jgi:PAS domain S-box-containing protein